MSLQEFLEACKFYWEGGLELPMKRRNYEWMMATIAAIGLSSCSMSTGLNNQRMNNNHETSLKSVAIDQKKIVMGQTLYVPIYSHIYHYTSRDHRMNLSATVSIRNTDSKNSIIITSVRYYDTHGKLIRTYITNPVELNSLSSTEFFVASDDEQGGVGANFIVEWAAEKRVHEPIVEAVMISTYSSQGISFVSPAKVLEQYPAQD